MGLDVYVGSLIRYYTGDWETIVQRLGREAGMQVVVQRPPQPKGTWLDRLLELFAPKGAEAARRHLDAWRRQLERETGSRIEWKEDPDGVYFTDKPMGLLWRARPVGCL